MTVNKFIEAIAAKLTALWPDKKVYVDEIPQGADGNFSIQVIETSQSKHLGNRHKRTYQFDVAYIKKKHDAMNYHAWAETMYMEFGTIKIDDMTFHMTNLHTDTVDGIFHFLMDVTFMALFVPESNDEPMEDLQVFADLNIRSYKNVHIVGVLSLGADGREYLYQFPECGPNHSGGV